MRIRGLILSLLFALSALAAAPYSEIDYDQWLYIGNYRNPPTAEMNEHRVGVSEGIYVTGYRSAWGIVEPNPRLAAAVPSPNFFAVSPDRKVLYTCTTGREVDAFAVDAKTGDLTLINKVQGNEGALGYCHVAVSPDGRVLAAADYPAGLFDFFKLNADGSIGGQFARFDKFGSGPDKIRQEHPYGHSSYFIDDGAGPIRALLVDLGSDRVSIVSLDRATLAVTQDPDYPEMRVPAGHGCRHLAWRRLADGAYDFFVNNELGSSVTWFRVRFGDGNGTKTVGETIGTWSTLPPEFDGKVNWNQAEVDASEDLTLMNSTAEAAVREGDDGGPATLYVSNRGHDSIAVFQILDQKENKELKAVQFMTTFGRSPRYFAIDKTGKHMLVCNKRSGSIRLFTIEKGGTLKPSILPPVWTPWPLALEFIDKEK